MAEASHRAGVAAILGRPNVGKSTLLNRLLGEQLAIVTAKPQTTRSRILGILTLDGAQVLLLDTPGMHAGGKALNMLLNELVDEAAADCDVALLLVDDGAVTRAVELYALASRYPFVANSRWFEDVAGREIAAAAAHPEDVPPDVVAVLWERGRARDLWATAEELFFYLLAHPADQPREQITDVFWPDLPPARAKSTFHSTVYRLRRATHMEILAFDRSSGTYELNLEVRYWYDVEEFEKLLKVAPGSGESRAEALHQAIALYRGEYMEGSYSDWCLPKRRSLEEQYLGALSELAHWCMDEGSYDQALELCEKALQKDNYYEEIYRLMMKCYSLLGQPARVSQVYQRCAMVLGEELGVEPAAETVALYQEL